MPERRAELTTEGGLDVAGQEAKIKVACERLAAAGCVVSLFIDADPAQLEAAIRAGAPAVEIHTGRYADAPDARYMNDELRRIRQAVEAGVAAGIQVNAGHGLNYHNVRSIAAIATLYHRARAGGRPDLLGRPIDPIRLGTDQVKLGPGEDGSTCQAGALLGLRGSNGDNEWLLRCR